MKALMAGLMALLLVAGVSAGADSAPVPPKDALWTLYCRTFSGAMHIEEAKRCKADLLKMTQMPDWYVVHGDNESTLFYGYYRAIDDPADRDSKRAQADRTKIMGLKSPAGEPLAQFCLFVEINSNDPPAPPEWNILNKDREKSPKDPTRAYWSLEIASYLDSPERKQAAVDAVREARAQGVEAYYFHGATISSVLVGAWPADAIKRQQMDKAGAPEGKTVIVSQVPLPAGTKLPDNATVLSPHLEPVDPGLLEMMKKYPVHYVNGQVRVRKVKNTQTGQVEKMPEESILVIIPRKDAGVPTAGAAPASPGDLLPPSPSRGTESSPPPQPPSVTADPTAPVAPPEPVRGTGRLKGVGG